MLSMLPWILFAQASWGVNNVQAASPMPAWRAEARVEIRDSGGLFGEAAGKQALKLVEGIENGHRVRILIETVSSLNGSRIADEARRRAEKVEADRLYVLVVGDEPDVGMIAARRGLAARLTDEERARIRDAFLEPLRAGDPAMGLDLGLRAIAATLREIASGPRSEARWVVLFAMTLLSILLVSWLREWILGWRAAGRRDDADLSDDDLLLGWVSRGASAPARVGSGRAPSGRRHGAATADTSWRTSRRVEPTIARGRRGILEIE